MADAIIARAHDDRPSAFTQDEIGWTPWLEPLREDELTDRHWAGLVDASRAKSAYFMVLARDPEILEARTKTDKDIFYNPAAGLPRAERELAAAATSRDNGCIFCASVHARFATTHSRRREDVQRLLDEGTRLSRRPSRSPRPRSASAQRRSRACAGPASTISRSPTSSTAPPSSTGPTG
jgi:uncharacterized peroxidase-related enzyme